jgi:hypothetical protein
MVHEGPSLGYDYNLYNIAGNIPLPKFTIAHKCPSHGYDYNPYHTVGNISPPTSSPQARMRDEDEEEFQRQVEEAIRQSQEEYIQKLEEDHH